MGSPDIFIAGAIQGSEPGRGIVAQDYRPLLKEIIRATAPGATIYDPFENHPGSVDYTLSEARSTFFGHVELVRRSKVLIAYLPGASLGTAIEMWEAFHRGVPVVTISPLTENWVIRLLSAFAFEDLEGFRRWAEEGELERLVARGGDG